jgi:uncharacterized protein YjiS (DUF1127 family)
MTTMELGASSISAWMRSYSLSVLKHLVVEIRRRRMIADGRRQLMGMDEMMLKDIGLTRCDVGGNFWMASERRPVVE